MQDVLNQTQHLLLISNYILADSLHLARNLEKHAGELEKVWSLGKGKAIMLVNATLTSLSDAFKDHIAD